MFKIGDRVFPMKKSLGSNLDESVVWGRAKAEGQNYLYIIEVDGTWAGETVYIANSHLNSFTGDFFLESDIVIATAINKGR